MPQCLTAQQVAAEAVRDGERIALGAGAELEVPFEVGRPHGIGLVLCTKAVGPERIAGYLQRYHQVSSQKYRRHKQRWKRYEKQQPGHRLQVDVKFLERIPGTRKRFYQFTAIDIAPAYGSSRFTTHAIKRQPSSSSTR